MYVNWDFSDPRGKSEYNGPTVIVIRGIAESLGRCYPIISILCERGITEKRQSIKVLKKMAKVQCHFSMMDCPQSTNNRETATFCPKHSKYPRWIRKSIFWWWMFRGEFCYIRVGNESDTNSAQDNHKFDSKKKKTYVKMQFIGTNRSVLNGRAVSSFVQWHIPSS